MQEKTADKLIGFKGHGFDRIAVITVPAGEVDLIALHGLNFAVGDGHSVGVAAKVF